MTTNQENLEIMDESIWTHGDTFPDVSDETLKEVVIGIADGRIFTDRHIHQADPSIMVIIFMPLSLGAFPPSCPKSYLDSLGLFYEYLSAAGTRCINGYPTFFSVRMMNKAQAARVFEAVDKELDRRENVRI